MALACLWSSRPQERTYKAARDTMQGLSADEEILALKIDFDGTGGNRRF